MLEKIDGRVVAKRRLLIAFVLALGALAIMLLGTGAAHARSEPGGMKGTFEVAPSRPGDHLVYALTVLASSDLDQGGWGMDAGGRWEIERLADRSFPLASAQPLASYASSWGTTETNWGNWGWGSWGMGQGFGFGSPGSIRGEPWHVAHVDASHQAIATTRVASHPDLPGQLLAADLAQQGVELGSTLLTTLGPSSAPCGFHSSLQDGPQPLSRLVRVDGQCPPPGGSFGFMPANLTSPYFLASGHDVVQGRPAIVYGHESGAHNMRLWFAADVPYPVRMVVPTLIVDNVGIQLLYEMTEFTPGQLADGTAVPVQMTAQRQVTGPDATNVQHPFPLVDALAAARDDDDDAGTREFLASHPEAAMDEARFVRLRDGDLLQERWAFTLVAGGDALHVTATKGAPPDPPLIDPSGLPAGIPPGVLPTDDGVLVRSQSGSSAGRIAPANMEAALPKVADLLAAWSADGGSGGTPSWAFHLQGGGATWVAAGQAEAVTTRSGPNDEGTTTLAYSFIGTDAAGSLRFAEESPGRYVVPGTRSAEEVGAGYDPDNDPDWRDPSSFALASVGFWSFPESETAATVSVAATTVGVLAYLFLPAKFGALGLFSRIGSDQVLEHPLRAQIAQLVEAEPGIHFQELVRRLDAGRGTMEHHLRKLVAANVLSMQVSQGFNCFFPKGKVDRHLMAAAPVLKSDGARQVLQAIQAQPGRAAQDIAAAIGLTPSTVNYHLKRLVSSGLVSHERQGRFILLTPTPLGTQALGAWGRT